jgi:2-dehydropantoate 2-reductase
MKIIIMGAGAIGSLYGGLLELGGHDVTLVGRESHIEAVQKNGLQVLGVLGEHSVKLKALMEPGEMHDADYVFITTKAYDVEPAAKSIKHLIGPETNVVCLQNGIGTETRVEAVLETQRVLRATTCMGALVTRPGEVTVTGVGVTEIGSHHHENQPAVQKLVEILRDIGFNVRGSDNIDGVIWTKTIVNCGINPIGALTGLTNGEVYNSQELRGLVIHLVNEVVRVIKELGIELTTDDPIRYTLGTAKATGDNINSMLQDIQAHKRTEVEFITGEVIRLARELGIATPYNETVYALVRALESRMLREKKEIPVPRLSTEQMVEVLTKP